MTDELDDLRRQAKTLHKQYENGDRTAIARIDLIKPRKGDLKHADFLHVIAREQNFASWPQLKTAVETHGMDRAAKQQRLKIALYHGQHQVVQQLMWDTPDLADGAFGLQVALYDLSAVRKVLSVDPEAATRNYGPRRPILHLAFSKMLVAWPQKEADMLEIAALLVAHGADVNDGYAEQPGDHHLLSALYGALGHAGNMPLAQWLIDHGADPNDGESLYHATELGHHEGLRMVLAAGARPAGTNALKRALDSHDPTMVKMLLDAGADPNEDDGQMTALHHAALRACPPAICQLLLDFGADQSIIRNGVSVYSVARVYGHAALANMLAPTPLSPTEQLLAQAADGTVPPGIFIDPATVPPIYADIVCEIVQFADPLPHLMALVSLGMPWDKPGAMGITPVQSAGWEGLPDVMGYFLGLNPDLSHINGYGGSLLSTIIHGSENCPKRASRDHIGCLRLALERGVALPQKVIEFSGLPEVSVFLSDWAKAHPGQVVAHGIA